MNLHAIRAIYMFEMARTARTLMQSIIAPVISTSLYFVVFGAAIGTRIPQVEGVRWIAEHATHVVRMLATAVEIGVVANVRGKVHDRIGNGHQGLSAQR